MPLTLPATVGPYRLVDALGAGGMGTVYRALALAGSPVAAGTVVALKVIHPHLAADPAFRVRFSREARIGLGIRHRNVVAALDAGTTTVDGVEAPWIALEFVEGRSLRSLEQELGRLPETLVRHVGREVARGLAALHAAGVVHRDLKPENVLVTSDHAVRVADLGLARATDASRATSGGFVGSLLYAAPERLQDDAGGNDPRSDLYALGLVLFEATAGRHPFEGADVAAVLRRQLSEDPAPLASVSGEASPFLAAVVRTLVAKDPRARFPDATSVADTLAAGEASAWWRERRASELERGAEPVVRRRAPRRTDLVGRDAEVTRVLAAVDAARAGRGGALLVVGEAGVGKTRLVEEALERAAAAGPLTVGRGACGGAWTGLEALRDAVRDLLGPAPAARVASAMPDAPALARSFAAFLAGEAETPAEALTGPRLYNAFARTLRALADAAPVVVLVEDLHRASAEARDLVAALARASEGRRLLVVATSRPGLPAAFEADLPGAGVPAVLRLEGLAPDAARSLVARALRVARAPRALEDPLVAATGGNPYFLLETIADLEAAGRLVRRGDAVVLAGPRDVPSLPASVRDLLRARLATLAPEDRALLEAAACAGDEPDPVVVARAAGVPEIAALQTFARLERDGRGLRARGGRLAFDPPQVAELLRDELPPALRERLHAAVAQALEARGPDEAGEGKFAVEVATQWLRARRAADAAPRLAGALKHTDRLADWDGIVQLADLALAARDAATGVPRAKLLLQRAYAHGRRGRRDLEERDLVEAEGIAAETGQLSLRAQVLRQRGHAAHALARPADAMRLFSEAADVARAADDRRELWAAMGNLGLVHDHLGHFEEAYAHLEQAWMLAAAEGDAKNESLARSNLGLVVRGAGRHAEAMSHFRAAIERAVDARDVRAEVAARTNLAVAYLDDGRYTESIAESQFVRETARGRGDRGEEGIANVNIASALTGLGRLDEAEAHAREARALFREIGGRYHESYAIGALADVAVARGDLEGSRALAADAVASARAAGDPYGEAMVLATQARAHDDAAQARVALAVAEPINARPVLAMALGALARHDADAAARLRALVDDATTTLARAPRLLAWTDLALGRRDPADVARAKALARELLEAQPAEARAAMAARGYDVRPALAL